MRPRIPPIPPALRQLLSKLGPRAWGLIGIAILLVGLLMWKQGWHPWAGPKGPSGPPVVPVEVGLVQQRDIAETLSVTGAFRAIESVDLRPEIAGRIAEIGFRDGQRVAKGALLIRLDDSLARAEFAQAEAEAALAESNNKRAQDLFARQFISSRALDEAKANAEIAAAKRDLARARLNRTRIESPFAGVVGLRQHSPGDFVKEGEVVAVVEDSSRLFFDFRVPERFLRELRVGQAISIETEQLPKPLKATVSAMDARVDAEGRFIQLRAVVVNESGALKSGLFARARLSLAEKPAALLVSEEALVGEQAGFFVWRVVDGKVEKVPVKLGTRLEKEVEVVSGLAKDDQVVIAGQLKIRRPGQPVKILTAPPAKEGPGPLKK